MLNILLKRQETLSHPFCYLVSSYYSNVFKTPVMSDPDNSTYRTWASQTIPELALDKWTGVNDKGLLQFKSTYFTSDEVSDNPLFACDTAYHARYSNSLGFQLNF